MTEIRSWDDTAAGQLVNGGWRPGTDWEAKAAEWRQQRAEFDARVQADPAWAASRRSQQELAARGWTGNVINISPSVPAELMPFYAAQTLRQAATRTDRPGQPPVYSGTAEAVELMQQIEQAQRDRWAANQLRQQVLNSRLPPGAPQ